MEYYYKIKILDKSLGRNRWVRFSYGSKTGMKIRFVFFDYSYNFKTYEDANQIAERYLSEFPYQIVKFIYDQRGTFPLFLFGDD